MMSSAPTRGHSNLPQLPNRFENTNDQPTSVVLNKYSSEHPLLNINLLSHILPYAATELNSPFIFKSVCSAWAETVVYWGAGSNSWKFYFDRLRQQDPEKANIQLMRLLKFSFNGIVKSPKDYWNLDAIFFVCDELQFRITSLNYDDEDSEKNPRLSDTTVSEARISLCQNEVLRCNNDNALKRCFFNFSRLFCGVALTFIIWETLEMYLYHRVSSPALSCYTKIAQIILEEHVEAIREQLLAAPFLRDALLYGGRDKFSVLITTLSNTDEELFVTLCGNCSSVPFEVPYEGLPVFAWACASNHNQEAEMILNNFRNVKELALVRRFLEFDIDFGPGSPALVPGETAIHFALEFLPTSTVKTLVELIKRAGDRNYLESHLSRSGSNNHQDKKLPPLYYAFLFDEPSSSSLYANVDDQRKDLFQTVQYFVNLLREEFGNEFLRQQLNDIDFKVGLFRDPSLLKCADLLLDVVGDVYGKLGLKLFLENNTGLLGHFCQLRNGRVCELLKDFHVIQENSDSNGDGVAADPIVSTFSGNRLKVCGFLAPEPPRRLPEDSPLSEDEIDFDEAEDEDMYEGEFVHMEEPLFEICELAPLWVCYPVEFVEKFVDKLLEADGGGTALLRKHFMTHAEKDKNILDYEMDEETREFLMELSKKYKLFEEQK